MSSYTVEKNLVFHQTEKEFLTGDLYLPNKREDTAIVLMIHGGAYQAGGKEMYADWGPYLAQQGFAAFSINYRLATKTTPAYPGLIKDVEAALHYLVKRSNQLQLDPQKISIMGDSAGAYLASMVALKDGYTSYQIKSIVAAYGVFDLVEWYQYTDKTREDQVINKLFGYQGFTEAKIPHTSSPLNLVENVTDFIGFQLEYLMIWGEADEIVLPENQSVKFVERLMEFGVRHEIITVPNYGHFWFTRNRDDLADSSLRIEPNLTVVPQVLAFLQRTLVSQGQSDPTAN